MEKRIKDRYNDSILQQVMKSYEIQKDDIQLLDGFESFIYEFNRKGSSFILRIGHNLRRSENLIRGEVDWINYLAAGGAGVARAIESLNGKLVEELPPIAASVEMFHLSSLIHDDVVDNSQLRRGARTLNFSFGNHISVLWGDYLFINSLFSIHKLRNANVLDIMLESALLMIASLLVPALIHFG